MVILYLTANLHQNLLNSANSYNERSGMILAVKIKPTIYFSLVVFIGSEGRAGHAQQSEGEVNLEEVYIQNSSLYRDFKLIPFHTHSRGTIEEFGEGYRGAFSEKDVRNMLSLNAQTNGIINTFILFSCRAKPLVAHVEQNEIFFDEYGVKQVDAEMLRYAQEVLSDFISRIGLSGAVTWSFDNLYRL